MIKTVEWTSEGVRMLDQRLLPTEEKYLTLRSYEEVADAIKQMVVRGAPAIGVSAAMGLALGASQSVGTSVADLEFDFKFMCKVMEATRPTAVNLFWAVERMRGVIAKAKAEKVHDVEEIKNRLTAEALTIFQEDIEANRALGRFGGELIPDGATVLTHCNAGALATAGDYGTALGVIRGAIDAGKKVAVIADETRPFLQGARLTAWELAKDNIPVTVITDNMAGHVIEGRQSRLRGGRRRSHRRQWRYGQQDRNLYGGGDGKAAQHPFLCRGPDLDDRSGHGNGRRHSHRTARRQRGDARGRNTTHSRRHIGAQFCF